MLDMASKECYYCKGAIENDTPRVDLFCLHSFHTFCYCSMTWEEYRCSCGESIISQAMLDQFRAAAQVSQVTDTSHVVDRLKAEDGFTKDLRELKKNIARAKKARAAFNRVCRARRATFIAETRPFVERIHYLQKASVKEVRASVEAKAVRSESMSVYKKLHAMERVYPQFKKDTMLYRMLRLGSPWRLRCSLRMSMWKMRRFFRTMPRLF